MTEAVCASVFFENMDTNEDWTVSANDDFGDVSMVEGKRYIFADE
ncbi:hypothetical protein [Thermaerobacillus caldiproteolyticus]|uniref:Uncharacterized protein n=1 Tax=Thermaerobacillus caldiproteolyticus TaxID=247480 RepID=A0A7W0BZY3_9BACL|nr:hypothetical protein [Anoxybacillus caldiproteolyticus]MBA2876085.1 hypothetical protein [Anoxybacillus caldiproteolyticus]